LKSARIPPEIAGFTKIGFVRKEPPRRQADAPVEIAGPAHHEVYRLPSGKL
jgi:hypothetical protein